MQSSLKAIFARKAGALLLAGSMASGYAVARPKAAPRADAGGQPDIATLVPLKGSTCVALDRVAAPEKPIERYVAGMYDSNRETVIGRMLLDAEKEPSLKICFDHSLNKRNGCGFVSLGYMNPMELMLNPSRDISDIRRNYTAIHEIRHHFQASHGLAFGSGKNVPPEIRVQVYWLQEADARMASVLYAWEWDRKGHPEYKAALMLDDGYRSAVVDFYAAIEAHPDDVAAAARAAVMAWLKSEVIKTNYANNAADFIDRSAPFDPDGEVEDLLSVGRMIEIGDLGEYGNYMDLDVIGAFTNAFTAADYARLAEKRMAAKSGHSCTP